MSEHAAVSKPRWEARILGWLEYPMNLAFVNLIWFAFALPLVTWLPATVALLHSLDCWLRDGDDRVFRNFLDGWRRHWRRALPLGVASTATAAMLASNALFLSTRPTGVATVLLGGTGLLGLVWILLHLWLLPVMAMFGDLPLGRALSESAALALANLPVTLLMGALTVVFAAVLAVFWTLVPFYGASLIGFLALRMCYRATDAAT